MTIATMFHSPAAGPASMIGMNLEQWRNLAPDVRQDIRTTAFARLALRNPNWLAAPSRLERCYPEDDKPYDVTPAGIAVIRIMGPTVNRDSWFYASYPQIRRMVGDAATDDAVKGILLHVNSPGGETDGAFEAADDIEAAAQLKPVWAVADSDAFSAGYLLASAASTIYVNPTTGGVGSIGVICQHVDYSEYLKKEGVKVTPVYAGERKNDFSPYQPLSKDARAVLEAEVSRLYGLFADAVARRRKMSIDAVRGTEAGLFFGIDGISARLADQAGDYRDALSALTDFVSKSASPSLFGNSSRMAAADVRHSTAAGNGAAVTSTTEEVSPMAAEPTTTTTAGQQQQPDVESIRRTAEAEGYGAAAEIVSLCTIAGVPDRAAGFIAARTPAAAVRAELLALAASRSSNGEEIKSEVPAGGTGNKASAAASFDLKSSMQDYLKRTGRIK